MKTAFLLPTLLVALPAQAPTEALFKQEPLVAARACIDRALALDPKKAEHLLLLGCIAQSQGDTQRAQEAFQRAQALGGRDVESLAEVGRGYLVAGLRKEAEEIFARAQAIKPKDLNTYRYIALAWMKAGISEPVAGLVAKAMERARGDNGPAADFAVELLNAGRNEEAHALMEASYKGDPKAWDDFIRFGAACLKTRQPQTAPLWFDRALAGRPGEVRARREIVNAYADYGTREDCEANKARLLECLTYGFPPKDRDNETLVVLARCHLALGDRAKAEEIFKQIVMSKNVDAEAFRLIGNAWLRAGVEPEAFRAYEVIVNAKGSGGTLRIGTGGFANQGGGFGMGWGAAVSVDLSKLNRKHALADAALDLATHGHLDKALPLMNEAFLTDADDFDNALQFAQLCWEAGKDDEAVRFLVLGGKTGVKDADYWSKAASLLLGRAQRKPTSTVAKVEATTQP